MRGVLTSVRYSKTNDIRQTAFCPDHHVLFCQRRSNSTNKCNYSTRMKGQRSEKVNTQTSASIKQLRNAVGFCLHTVSLSLLFNKWHSDIPQSPDHTLESHPNVRQIVFEIVSERDLLHPCFLLSFSLSVSVEQTNTLPHTLTQFNKQAPTLPLQR